ncbi:MAG: alcohol dehydrogenase catalytic domain-containing protein [Kiritimatiellae bacterium]|nr:alcohol dehydrogenase catalytic domain-containing protein [Kiritimatiellia bacterium]
MKRTMKAARISGPTDMKIVEVPVPDLGAHDVLCRVVRAGVCSTDYAIYTGELSFVKTGLVKYPLTPGHEWSGIVELVGPEVENFKPGDRVVGDTFVACGSCGFCITGNFYRCNKIRSVGTINAWDGAYAEYIMMPERHLFHLPENVSLDNGALVEPTATALYAVTLAGVKIADTVLVLGSGPIGIIAAKMAKLSGAGKVIIAGRKDSKLKTALALGVDAVVNTTKEHLAEKTREYSGEYGVDRIIEASGSTELFKEALQLVKPGGVISCVAFYERPVDGFDIDRFVINDVTIRAVAGSQGMYPTVLKLMDLGLADFSSLITERRPFVEAPQIMHDMQQRNETRIKIMLEMEK